MGIRAPRPHALHIRSVAGSLSRLDGGRPTPLLHLESNWRSKYFLAGERRDGSTSTTDAEYRGWRPRYHRRVTRWHVGDRSGGPRAGIRCWSPVALGSSDRAAREHIFQRAKR